jgi:DUF4097 and DUF4098 domain-containing protein YvlB
MRRPVFRQIVLAVVVLALPVASQAATKTLDGTKSFPAKAGGTVVVDVSFHQVEVRVENRSTVEFRVELEMSGSQSRAERLIEEYTPEFTARGDEIKVRSTSTRRIGFSWGSTRKHGRVFVSMPTDMNLTVDSSSGSCEINGDFGDSRVVADTSSGKVVVHGSMRELVADTSSGSVEVELTGPAETVRMDTSSGSVQLRGPAADVVADTSSGSVGLSGLTGDLAADTSSGGVSASWTSIPSGASVRADTSSGSVRLTFPRGTVLGGLVDTSSGGITSDFGGDRSDRGHHLELDGGPGAVKVHVDTSSGGVKLLEE